jgi:formamidopyrimidine-DNA glycosylase
MPELPEVETICNILRTGGPEQPALLGKRIRDVQVLWERTLVTPGIVEFGRRIGQQRIEEIGRRGKFLIFGLSPDALLIHLRMSGDLLVEKQDVPLAPHHRLVINFDDGLRLAFNDPRKFGRVWFLADPSSILAELGPEPLDAQFTAQVLYQRLQEHRRQLKPLLLDQSFLAGLGNIYADEALHLARLHPRMLSDQMTWEQVERLWGAIRHVLAEGIRRNGASIDWVYRGGEFQNYFRVYQRTGQPCLVCGAAIQRIVIGQRGTHLCPVCQQLPPGVL